MVLTKVSAIGRCLEKFKAAKCKPVPTSMDKNCFALLRTDAELAHDLPYRELTGSLLYPAICTRPDLSFFGLILAQHCEGPTKLHREMTKRLFRYFKDTF